MRTGRAPWRASIRISRRCGRASSTRSWKRSSGRTTLSRLVSFFKNISLAASRQVQLRWEIYNVTNTPIFNVPGSALGTPTFGVISNVGNSIARQMQFAARFTF